MEDKKISRKVSACRTIFLDFEFYVPEKDRLKNGFCYNPWNKNCKFLGGSFLAAHPFNDLKYSSKNIEKKIKSFWLWDYKSEKELLTDIYLFLKEILEEVRVYNTTTLSPVLCGIGIVSADIPILFSLFQRYQILTNEEAFNFQHQFRVIDLSQLVIGTFDNKTKFLYPAAKNKIMQKYFPGKKFEDGRIVWKLFEKKNFKLIESRVLDEIISTRLCYLRTVSEFNYFKDLQKEKSVKASKQKKTKVINK